MNKKLLVIGSASIHTYNYIALVKSYFNEIVLVTTSDKKYDDSQISNKYIINDSLRNPLNFLSTTHKLKKILAAEKPSVIHIQQISTYGLMILLANSKYNIPVVSTAWGSDVLINPQKNLLHKLMVRYCIEQSNALTADACYIAKKMQDLSRKKIDVTIANFGIDIPESVRINKENIIYSNRLHNKLYRIDEIILAFSRFVSKKQFSDWKLIIAATGTETDSLKELVSKLNIVDSVNFVGWVDKNENMHWYKKAKIWISLPESDATAISMLEAMGNGCIPIVTDLPASKEWIDNNVNGLLVKDVNDLDISKALSLDYQYLNSYNYNLIVKEASKDVNRNKFINIYKSMIN